MLPEQFTLGGMKYQVLVKDVPGYRWKSYPPIQELHLAPSYQGKELRQEIIEKHFWEAVAFLVIDRVMLRTKGVYAENRPAVGNLVAQVMIQLSKYKEHLFEIISSKVSRYGIQVGAADIEIVIDNIECDKRKVYGEYDGNAEKIILQSEGVSEEVFMKYTPEFMLRVLIHECLHAIVAQLGLSQTKWNTEHNINTMAYFFTEVYLSLKLTKDEKQDSIVSNLHGSLGSI